MFCTRKQAFLHFAFIILHFTLNQIYNNNRSANSTNLKIESALLFRKIILPSIKKFKIKKFI